MSTIPDQQIKLPALVGGPPRIWDVPLQSAERLFRITGNTGNLAFRYALFKQLGRDARVFSWNDDAVQLNSVSTVAVFPCANQIGAHQDCESRASFTKQLDVPVLAIGLGAQAENQEVFPDVPKGTLKWLKEIQERRAGASANITVRGEYTRRVLESLGFKDGVEVLGCPSLFINESLSLGKSIANKLDSPPVRIGIAAGNPSRPVSSSLEAKLITLALRSGGSYVVQHPLPFVQVARREFEGVSDEWLKKIFLFINSDINCEIPKSRHELIGKLSSRSGNFSHAHSFFDIETWMEHLKMHDFVIGLRIHGVMLAIQAGTPAVCITHDSRTEELCQTMCIPYVKAQELEEKGVILQDLYDIVRNSATSFDSNRKLIASKYIRILSSAGITPAKYLLSFANS